MGKNRIQSFFHSEYLIIVVLILCLRVYAIFFILFYINVITPIISFSF